MIEHVDISEKQAKNIIVNLGRRFNIYLDVLKYSDGATMTHSLIGFRFPSKEFRFPSNKADNIFPKFISYDEIDEFSRTHKIEYYFIEAEGEAKGTYYNKKFINILAKESRKYGTALKEMMKLCSENRDIIYPYYGNSVVLIPRNTTIYELLIKHDLISNDTL